MCASHEWPSYTEGCWCIEECAQTQLATAVKYIAERVGIEQSHDPERACDSEVWLLKLMRGRLSDGRCSSPHVSVLVSLFRDSGSLS